LNSLMYRILCVDDDEMILTLYSNIFRMLKTEFGPTSQIKEKTFSTTCCKNGNNALDAVKNSTTSNEPFSIAFIDINMPGGKDGYETAKEIRDIDERIEIVIVTGEDIGEVSSKINKISQNHKLFFLRKPFQMQEFRQLALTLSEKWEYHTLNIELINKLEHKIHLSEQNLREIFPRIIKSLSSTVEIRDVYTAGHQTRVANLAQQIAQTMNLPNDEIQGIYIAGLLHDIGKIAIPAEILSKPSKLLDLEFSLIKNHVNVGYEIIKEIHFPWPVDTYLLQHHERNDGSGYPNGTKKEDILLGSAILIVADVVEAISSHRPYRPALGIDFAISEISKNKGTKFDDSVVEACLKVLQKKDFSFE
jgi:putative nucleotidyltransferase with HDIG domain